MLDQQEDGSHEITLHDIIRVGCAAFPNATGTMRWTAEKGVEYTISFPGTSAITPKYYRPDRSSAGAGRLSELDTATPSWTATTDDGTRVELYVMQEEFGATQTTGTSGNSSSCHFNGTALYAIVDIPSDRMLAFDNATTEPIRFFFVGHCARYFHFTDEVSFTARDGGVHSTCRCGIRLSDTPQISLVSSHGFVRTRPSGWLGFQEYPGPLGLKQPTSSEIGFISFLNGYLVSFHWSDQRLDSNVIRRTYYGWERSRDAQSRVSHFGPLPFLGGIETMSHGQDVLKRLPNFFQMFVQRGQDFDFVRALHPTWTAIDSVLQDRLALVSVSLERLATIWHDVRQSIIGEKQRTGTGIWSNKPLLKELRAELVSSVQRFLSLIPDGSLNLTDRNELQEVLVSRIGNWTDATNSAKLRAPFVEFGITLTEQEHQALRQRNSALHGTQNENGCELAHLDQETLYFDILRMMLTKFVLRLCSYDGPFIDYASRPATGNFEIKSMSPPL